MSIEKQMPQRARFSENDAQAALELAREDNLLMNDEETKYIIEHGGVTRYGEQIKDIGNYLNARRAKLEKDGKENPANVRTREDAMAVHSKTWQEKEGHE
jgi:hypothetical protein